VDPCLLEANEGYCLNGGVCRQVPVQPEYLYCQCRPDWTGERCESAKTEDYYLYYAPPPSNSTTTATNQPIQSSPNVTWSALSGGFTLCAWVKYDQAAPDGAAFVTLGTEGWTMLEIGQSGVMLANGSSELDGGNGGNGKVIGNGLWHEVCLVMAAAPKAREQWTLYVDGEWVNTTLLHTQSSSDGQGGELRQNGIFNFFRFLKNHNFIKTPVQSTSLCRLHLPSSESTGFVGELALVRLFNTTLNSSSIRELVSNCHDPTLLPAQPLVSWSQFTTLDEYDYDRVVAIAPGICSGSACPTGSTDCQQGRDKRAPKVVNCPGDQLLVLEASRLVQVQWNDSVEWMFHDREGPIVRVESNFRSGQSFGWGEHHVVYRASDASGNEARCEFDVVVAPRRCAKPSYGGEYTEAMVRAMPTREVGDLGDLKNGV